MEDQTPELESNQDGSGAKKRSTGRTILIVGLLAAVILIGVGMFLPPVSLGDRLGLTGDDEATTTESVEATSADTTSSSSSAELTVNSAENVSIDVLSPADFAAADTWQAASAALPGAVLGSVYVLDSRADAPSGSLRMALPTDPATARTADLYGWNGSEWVFLPGSVEQNSLISAEATLPQAAALIATTKPADPVIAAEVLPEQTLPDAARPLLSSVIVGTLTLGPDGLITGRAAEVPPGSYSQYLRVTNTGAIVDQESLNSLMSNPAAQASQIQTLTQAAFDNGFAGINVDFQGNAPDFKDQFTQYLRDLDAALAAQNLDLIVTLAGPQELPTGEVITGGYDWAAIGAIADTIIVQMPLDPAGYDAAGAATQDLDWVVRQIPRSKTVALYTTNAVDKVGDSLRELPTGKALVNFGEIQLIEGAEKVPPETPIKVGLSGTAGELIWDGAARTYQYNYTQANQPHTVWLNNTAALAHRMNLADQYNLAGVNLRGLTSETAPDGHVDAINSYLGVSPAPDPAAAAIVWHVEDANGTVLATESGADQFTFEWPGSTENGIYAIKANFALGDSMSTLGVYNVAVEGEVEEVEVVEETDDSDVVEAPLSESVAATGTGSGGGVTTTQINFREGPGLSYGIIRGLDTGERVEITGKDASGLWFKVLDGEGVDGWVYAQLIAVDPDVNVASLPVATAPPAPAAAATAPATGGEPAAAPATAPVIPPSANTGSFELGGQAFGSPYGTMSYAGMTWVKRQHKWGPGNTGQEVAGTIADAHANGFKILLSLPGPRRPDSINFQEYVTFLGNVAALPDPPDAIEVWNEQNIDAEWPIGQIDPASFVNNLLAPGYNAIKAANPNIMVISGAPAPTGFFGGCSPNGCDDAVYVAGMAAAGAANYMDCIGIHYNEGIISPNQQSGDPRSEHYTRYFWGMTNAYYNAFGGSRPLCFTELGYLTSEGYGGLPGGFAWAGNVTVAQQAQWLAEATSLSANSGKVRLLIVWNVDSTTWGDDPQAGYAIIRPGGGCPACDALAQVMQ
ncbi:MAG: SH3 domain-containing protein [Anaerolineae bacterium]|nr:SH3 domain-containing protein [Anaerolineae bacterium]